jgi:uncharacterized heparinase superfamily protein
LPSLHSIGRYARTVALLRPAQVIHRVRLRGQAAVVARRPGLVEPRWTVDAGAPVGLPEVFVAIDARNPPPCGTFEDVAAGTFTHLNEQRALGADVAWDPDGASHLWLFHHHYWEWAWTLAGHPDREQARAVFARQWRSWREHATYGRLHAWAAYPASLRAWVLVNVFAPLVAGTDLESTVVDDVARHAGFLEHSLELDVGGNHVIKNLKGLVGCAVFLGDDRLRTLALDHLRTELDRQVLADGGHYELSPSYHCQVLADLIDVDGLLIAAGHRSLPELADAIGRMQTWLGAMRLPDGTLPPFNDAEPVPVERIELLEPADPPTGTLTVLADSGYVVVRRGPFHLVADVGQPGPADLPGHIHADCLSFELAVHGRRLVVDTGTSEYGSGPRRQYERSTAAHSTVEVDGHDQTEVYGAFRAGRRAHATLERADDDGTRVVVTASHDGYRHLPDRPVHRRTWTVTADAVTLTDAILGGDRRPHEVRARLHVAAPVVDHLGMVHRPAADEGQPALASVGPVEVDGWSSEGAPAAAATTWAATERAAGFGELVDAVAFECTFASFLPCTVRTRIEAAAQDFP